MLARLRSKRQPSLEGLDDSSLTRNIIGRMARIVKENMYYVESGSEFWGRCASSCSPREQTLLRSLDGEKLRDESP